jgi:hypothetical protein
MIRDAASTLALDTPTLAAAIRDAGGDGRYAVADARLGTWTPQSLATQWISQIVGQDVVFNSDVPKMISFEWLNEALAGGIDEEGKGNRALLGAFETASQLRRVLTQRPASLVLLTPDSGSPWLDESELLLGYVRELSPAIRITAIATAHSAPTPAESVADALAPPSQPRFSAIRAHSLVSAMPVALSPRLRSLLGEESATNLLILDNGWALATPESRLGEQWHFSAEQLARFSQPGLTSLRSFATFHAEPGLCSAMQLALEAWRLCYVGPRELAPILMDRAVDCARTPQERDMLLAQRQMLRIRTSSFAKAAAEPAPRESAAPDAAGTIEEGRGWGLALTGDAAGARDILRRARALRSIDPPDRAALLLLNISALAELRAGDAVGAMKLEKIIERRLSEIPGSEDLRFVNCINQARLYRYERDFDQSENYYRQAFETARGGRTDTDQVNVNLCFAQLAMARGHEADALLHWVRAAMQWCTNECPEALNWRVQMLVIEKERRVTVSSYAEAQALAEMLAGGFLRQLDRLAAINGIKIDADSNDALPFFVSDAVSTPATPPRVLGGTGWSVLATRVNIEPRCSGPMIERLRAWLTAWIRRRSAAADENCFLIDRRDGDEMPVDWATMLASAVDHGAGTIEFDGRCVALDRDDLTRAQHRRSLLLSPCVARVTDDEPPVVHFHRYRPPLALSPSHRELIDCARMAMPLSAILDRGPEPRSGLPLLRRQRVICLGPLASIDIDAFAARPGTSIVEPRQVLLASQPGLAPTRKAQ